MADFFKGLAGGFQTGLQLGQQLRERRKEDELAQAYAKPEEFVDYTPEQVKQIQGLQALGGYDVQAVPGAEGQAPTLRYTAKPQALYYDDAGQPEAPIEIAPQRVQRYGGQTVAGQFNPTDLRALQTREAAGVLGRYGDARGAAALDAQADELAYQAKYRPLQLQQLQASIDASSQQKELTGLNIKTAKRADTEQENYTNFSNFAAANPNATADELKKAAFEQFKFTPKQWKDAVNTRLGIKEDEQKEFVLNIKNKLKGKNLQQLGSLYNSDPDFDDKTDLAIVPGAKGAVTLNFIDKGTKKITSSQTFTNEALAVEYLNKQATEPETIGSWMINLRTKETDIESKQASIRASDSTVGLNNARMGQIRQMNEALATNLKNSEEARKIQADYSALDDTNDPGGSKRQSLITQFNMLSVKAGGTIPTGPAPKKPTVETPVELKQNTDGTYTAYSKDGGKALYNTYNGETIPLGMTADVYSKMKEDARTNGVRLITGEDNGRIVLKFAGADGKYYDTAEQAKYAKPPEKPAPAGGIDTSTRPRPSTQNRGEITAVTNPTTKQKTYAVEGLRQRFNTMEEARAAAAKLGSSDMGKAVSRYDD